MRADWRSDALTFFDPGEPMSEAKALPTNSIEPTVGRMVHYYDGVTRREFSATVTGVHPPCPWSGLPVIDVVVFGYRPPVLSSVSPGGDGKYHERQGADPQGATAPKRVYLCDAGTGPAFKEHAAWMPYQVQQAKPKDAPAAEAKPEPQYVEARPRTC